METVTIGNRIWKKVMPFILSDKPTSICFSNNLRGWVSGSKGMIWNTFDGGYTWTKQQSNISSDILKITVTQKYGAIITVDHEIWLTENEGINWSKELIPEKVINCYIFKEHIWLVCKANVDSNTNLLYWNRNPSTPWKKIIIPLYGLIDLSIKNDKTWLALGSKLLLGTENNGATFTSLGPEISNDVSLECFAGVDDKTYHLAYSQGLLSWPGILKSKNGGKSWKHQSRMFAYLFYKFVFANKKDGVLFCFEYNFSSVSVYFTENGGSNWELTDVKLKLKSAASNYVNDKAWLLIDHPETPYILILQ